MAFNAKAVAISTANTQVFECPATLSGSVHGLVISNVAAAPATLTLRYFDQSEGTTTMIRSVEIAAKGEFTFPKPINVTPGDKIIASASSAGHLVAFHSVYLTTEAPIEKGFTGRGEWVAGALYAVNDVTSKDGSSYIALADNKGNSPPSNFWMLLAKRAPGIVTVNGVAPDDDGEVTLLEATAVKAGLMASTDKEKLNSVDSGATSNATDTVLLDRANHTGTQTIDTITTLGETLGAKLDGTQGTATGLKHTFLPLGNISGATAINLATAGEFTATVTGNVTLSFTNPPAANEMQVVYLRLTNAGAFSIDWPAGTKFDGSAKEPLTAAGVDQLGLKFDPATGACTVYVIGLNVGVPV